MNDDEIVLVLLGDVDFNGVVTIGDASSIAQSFIGLYDFAQRECVQQMAGDVSRTDGLTIGDASSIAQSFIG